MCIPSCNLTTFKPKKGISARCESKKSPNPSPYFELCAVIPSFCLRQKQEPRKQHQTCLLCFYLPLPSTNPVSSIKPSQYQVCDLRPISTLSLDPFLTTPSPCGLSTGVSHPQYHTDLARIRPRRDEERSCHILEIPLNIWAEFLTPQLVGDSCAVTSFLGCGPVIRIRVRVHMYI